MCLQDFGQALRSEVLFGGILPPPAGAKRRMKPIFSAYVVQMCAQLPYTGGGPVPPCLEPAKQLRLSVLLAQEEKGWADNSLMRRCRQGDRCSGTTVTGRAPLPHSLPWTRSVRQGAHCATHLAKAANMQWQLLFLKSCIDYCGVECYQ